MQAISLWPSGPSCRALAAHREPAVSLTLENSLSGLVEELSPFKRCPAKKDVCLFTSKLVTTSQSGLRVVGVYMLNEVAIPNVQSDARFSKYVARSAFSRAPLEDINNQYVQHLNS